MEKKSDDHLTSINITVAGTSKDIHPWSCGLTKGPHLHIWTTRTWWTIRIDRILAFHILMPRGISWGHLFILTRIQVLLDIHQAHIASYQGWSTSGVKHQVLVKWSCVREKLLDIWGNNIWIWIKHTLYTLHFGTNKFRTNLRWRIYHWGSLKILLQAIG